MLINVTVKGALLEVLNDKKEVVGSISVDNYSISCDVSGMGQAIAAASVDIKAALMLAKSKLAETTV